MTNKEFQTLLSVYPDDMPIKILHTSTNFDDSIHDFTDENILHTSDTAWYKEAEEEDDEDTMGLGDGQQYLLLNPIII